MSIVAKRANGEGSKARKRKDGRYETHAVLDTLTGRTRVSFYGATAKGAYTKRTVALADQDRGVLFSDPKSLKVGEYLSSWLSNAARYQVSEGSYQRCERSCRNHLIPFFGQLKLRDLSAAHVRAF
jgi:Phage integrase, N-terminal SAM-like domain